MAEEGLSGYSYEAYLALESESETKYEFHDGFIIAMAGGAPEHGQIAVNFGRVVGNELINQGKRCIVYNSDVKVHIATARRTFYPDTSLVCGETERSEKDANAITNPILLLEVLSDSTVAFDRGAKFTYYRQLSSLREYVLISQNEAMVDTYYRTDNGTWEIRTFTNLEDRILLKSIDCEIQMADIYWLVPNIGEG